jgi:hypothetical protein
VKSAGNKSLGEFNLEGIPPAARGTPQIEVTFDIDANGILHVGERQGHRQGEQDHDQGELRPDRSVEMVKDAELNAEEDKKVKELAESRNQADALVHSTRKSLTEYGDKLEAGEKEDRSGDHRPGSLDQVGRQGRDRRQGRSAVDRFAEAGREDVRRHASAASCRAVLKARPRAASRPSHKTTWSTLTSRKSKTMICRRAAANDADVAGAGSAFSTVQNTASYDNMAKRDFYEVLGVAKSASDEIKKAIANWR